MLTALEGAQAGLGDQFVAHVGTTMALASAMPPDWFPKTGTPTAAQIATFVMRLHGLTTIVWANYPTAGVTRVSKSLEGSTAVQGGGSCLFVSHRSVESSEIENYYSP